METIGFKGFDWDCFSAGDTRLMMVRSIREYNIRTCPYSITTIPPTPILGLAGCWRGESLVFCVSTGGKRSNDFERLRIQWWRCQTMQFPQMAANWFRQSILLPLEFSVSFGGMIDGEMGMPTEVEDYLFDLRGYLVIEGAVEAELVAELNAIVDAYEDMEAGEWRGWVYRSTLVPEMKHLHQVFEMGEAFERLIDHPAWIERVNRFVGGDDGLFIDESFIDIRNKSTATRLHSGAHKRRIRTQFRYHNGQFRCGQINILLALTDMGPGDGATMVIPGSHKSNIIHPAFERRGGNLGMGAKVGEAQKRRGLEEVEGAVEVHYKAGDALLFVDCMAHGSATRINEGERRIVVIRYGPHWGFDRYGYQPSPELISRLTPERRRIVQPLSPKMPPCQPSIYQ